MFGSLAVLVALAYGGRLAVTRRPLRNAVWVAVAALFAGSLLAALDYAHVGLLARRARRRDGRRGLAAPMPPALRAVWVLVAAAWPACSAPSCSTSATSSTAARCTA